MEDIYLEMYDILLFKAKSIVGNEEDAKDIVQELYLKIKAQEHLSAVAVNPRGYLYGMVANMAKMFLRDQVRHRELEASAATAAEGASVLPMSWVDDFLAPLTALQRSVVRLHDIEGYSVVEIAVRLGRTTVSVKKQLALAHRRLKENHDG